MSRKILQTITVVDVRDIPRMAEDYLVDREVSLHSQNGIVQVEDDGNPFAEWLKENGYVFKYHNYKNSNIDFDEIGILAT